MYKLLLNVAELNESSGQRKKNLIENVLVPALDNAIIKVAKIRKRQPHKCRNKAREISCNVIQYYVRFFLIYYCPIVL